MYIAARTCACMRTHTCTQHTRGRAADAARSHSSAPPPLLPLILVGSNHRLLPPPAKQAQAAVPAWRLRLSGKRIIALLI
jgi:hypothetical protein